MNKPQREREREREREYSIVTSSVLSFLKAAKKDDKLSDNCHKTERKQDIILILMSTPARPN